MNDFMALYFVVMSNVIVSIDSHDLFLYSYYNSGLPELPGPFNNPTLNIVLWVLCAVTVVLLFLLMCCFCYFCFCRKNQEPDQLVVTPSELVAIGATPSELKAAKISPSVLKDSGATYDQMAQLGATPSQLVEAGAKKQDLERLGATRSQLSHVGFQDKKTKEEVIQSHISTQQKPLSEVPVSQTKAKEKVEPFVSTAPSTKPEDNKPMEQEKGQSMSNLADKLAQKLKDKPKKTSKPIKESDVKPKDVRHSQAKMTAPSTVPSKVPEPVPSTGPITAQKKEPADDTISTISTSPQKKAAALKPTDDSMSIAMGPSSKS